MVPTLSIFFIFLFFTKSEGKKLYSAFCNFPCNGCNTESFGLIDAQQTITSGSFGVWPLMSNGGSVIQNGGVPQLGNLSLHLEKVTSDVEINIPNASFAGNIVIDFESWTPIFARNTGSGWWHQQIYQDASVQLELRANASLSLSQAYVLAEAAFQSAAISFFSATAERIRQLRPKAAVGYYGFPQYYGDCFPTSETEGFLLCDYQNPLIAAELHGESDLLSEVWRSVNAFFPSVYADSEHWYNLDTDVWRLSNAATIRSTINETIRISATVSAPRPILPFYWGYYHNGTTLLQPDDIKLVISNAYVPPFTHGLILWGSGENKNDFSQFFETIEGPIFKSVIEDTQDCSNQICNGLGWCSTIPTLNNPASIPPPSWGNRTCIFPETK